MQQNCNIAKSMNCQGFYSMIQYGLKIEWIGKAQIGGNHV